MANEISSINTANVPSSAKGTGQSVKLEAVKVPDAGGKAMPKEGKAVPQQASQSTSTAELREAVTKINDFVQNVNRDVRFSMDEGSGRTVIRVLDTDSGDLVRQIPNDEVLAIARRLNEVRDMMIADQSSMPGGVLFSDIA